MSLLEFERRAALPGSGIDPELGEALHEFLEEEEEATWRAALLRVEWFASDRNIPTQATPAAVACLVGACAKLHGPKFLEALDSLDGLTCGRGLESHDPQQRAWYLEAAFELSLGLAVWTAWAEAGTEDEAKSCFWIAANCACALPPLRARICDYLTRAAERSRVLAALLPDALEHVRVSSEILDASSTAAK
jgi:hypothetical protein